jgi:RNA polymerase sigma factor (sigma-70 family)
MTQYRIKKQFLKYSLGLLSENDLFQEVWDLYGKKIHFFISSTLPSEREERDDLFQDVMIKIFSHIDSYNPLYSFNAWIYSIARNHCVDFLKKKKVPLEEISSRELFIEPSTAEELLTKNELIKEIDLSFEKLPGNEKQVAYLKLYEELTFREISSILDININSVKTIYSRASKKLQYYLKDYKDEKQ